MQEIKTSGNGFTGDYYRELLENLNEYIYCFMYEDGVQVSSFHSSRCRKVTGYDAEELEKIPDLWFSMIHADDRKEVDAFLSTFGMEKREGSIEHRITHRDGSVRWVSNAVSVELDEGGGIIRMNGLIHDITRRKSVEGELVKLYRAVEQSPATVVITDVQGAIEYVNPKFTSLTGYSFDEAIGQNPRVLKSGEQGRDFYAKLWKTILSGEEWRGEFHNKKKNGELYWEQASISPIRDRDGKVTHFVAVKEDVTARKAAEEALRESEEKLRQRNEAMEKDLSLAQLIQRSFLPDKPPVHEGLTIDYRYLPLEKVGGDYFTFKDNEDGSFGVFLGDVAGHGVAAALFLALVKSVADRISSEYGSAPSQYLGELNRLLVKEMVQNFITAVYCLFRMEEGRVTLTIANGGHPYPLIYRAGERTVAPVKTAGTVIGMVETALYRTETLELSPGDRVFIYTDGIPETENDGKEIIGFDKELEELFKRSQREDLGETLDSIIEEVRRFAGGNMLDDDIAIIGVEVKPWGPR